MNKAFLFASIFVLSLSACEQEDSFNVVSPLNGDVFFFDGTIYSTEAFPLCFFYEEGFKTPPISYIKAASFELLTEKTLKVGYSNEYLLAKKTAIKYDEYGAHSSGEGVYNGLWVLSRVYSYDKFLLAINSETMQAVIEFPGTGELFRKNFRTSYDDNGFLVVTIDSIDRDGRWQWVVTKNIASPDLNTGIASVTISNQAGEVLNYQNNLVIVDDKRLE